MGLEEHVVVKFTGKIFDNPSVLREYIVLLKKLVNKYSFTIIVGGGNKAREYINLAKTLNVNSNYWLDTIGIMVSRLNAYLLIASLYPHAYHKPVGDFEELHRAIKNNKLVFVGGLIPGQSTAAVAVEVAEALGVDKVIDLAAVDHVYDRDPRKYPNAKKYTEIKASDLKKILEQAIIPGEYALIDLKALDLAMRSGITIYLAYYGDPQNLVKILNGENPGTIIYPY